jgi:hypothetical protein
MGQGHRSTILTNSTNALIGQGNSSGVNGNQGKAKFQDNIIDQDRDAKQSYQD